MNGLNVALVAITCVFFPLFVLLGIAAVRSWRRDRLTERSPTAEKLLRPPGESLRRRIESLEGQFNEAFAYAIAVPAAMSASILLSEPTHPPGTIRWTIALAFSFVLVAYYSRKLFRVVTELRAYKLGLHGEQAVGEELNQLMLHGCRVFHDVPMEPYGNIDHVIVGPSGVYAVETKTRRKRKAPPGKKDYEVFYDGAALDFPHARDAHPVEQAKQQAARLRGFLSNAVGEPVAVTPILTIPGWFVSSRANTELKVLNPKGIKGLVTNSRTSALSSQLIQRIAHQLDQKCRDVEL